MADREDVAGPYRLVELLSSAERDFLVKRNGDQVKVNDLEGKVVGLYFSFWWGGLCEQFTPELVSAYEELAPKGDFEVVFVYVGEDQDEFDKCFSKMPWLAVPFSDSDTRWSLDQIFEVSGFPNLVILDGNGKLLTDDGIKMISEYGAESYPFSTERMQELKAEEEAAANNQSLKSLLVHSPRDFLMCNDGRKVPVSDLVGKTVLLYFSAHWCPPCRAFSPELIETYQKIKAKDSAFEIIFISSDRDQAAFEEYFATMPFLALPYGDKRKKSLSKTFKVAGIPTLVAIGPNGRTLTNDARSLVAKYGAAAYPFTDDRLEELEQGMEEMTKQWPKEVKHALHAEHSLKLSRRPDFICDACDSEGNDWSYLCAGCDFDLHPACALETQADSGVQDDQNGVGHEKQDEPSNEGWVCDGEACRKA